MEKIIEIPEIDGKTISIDFKNGVGPQLVVWSAPKGTPNRKVEQFVELPKNLSKAISEYVQDCIHGH